MTQSRHFATILIMFRINVALAVVVLVQDLVLGREGFAL